MWSRHNASVDGIRLGIVAFWCRCARSVSVIPTLVQNIVQREQNSTSLTTAGWDLTNNFVLYIVLVVISFVTPFNELFVRLVCPAELVERQARNADKECAIAHRDPLVRPRLRLKNTPRDGCPNAQRTVRENVLS
jgi:hypothetical protein